MDHLPKHIKQLNLRFFRTAWRQSAKRQSIRRRRRRLRDTGARNEPEITVRRRQLSFRCRILLCPSYRIPSHGWWNSPTLTRQLGKCYERKAGLSLSLTLLDFSYRAFRAASSIRLLRVKRNLRSCVWNPLPGRVLPAIKFAPSSHPSVGIQFFNWKRIFIIRPLDRLSGTRRNWKNSPCICIHHVNPYLSSVDRDVNLKNLCSQEVHNIPKALPCAVLN